MIKVVSSQNQICLQAKKTVDEMPALRNLGSQYINLTPTWIKSK